MLPRSTGVLSSSEKVGPSLPFGGAEAANLVLQVLDAVESAVANSENLKALCDRALSVLDVLRAYAAELGELQRCRAVVSRFHDHLLAILSYARAYTSRNCLMRLLTTGGDAKQYQDLVDELCRLADEMMMLLATDNNARLQAVQIGVHESLELLKQAVVYTDPAAEARALVEEFGGIEAVMASGAKMAAVMQKMDVSARMTIEVVSSLLKSHLDKGPQRHIRQPELRLFWAAHFNGEAEVPWFAFWDAFPGLLADVPGAAFDMAAVEELSRLLADGSARAAFQRAVERSGSKDTVSVWELKVSFQGEEALLAQVAGLVGGVASTKEAANITADAAAHGGGAAPAVTTSSPAAAAWRRCQLPSLPPTYTGRDEEADRIVQHFTAGTTADGSGNGGSSRLLLAEGGMGKSCLAADVGWRLLRGGHAAAGALWVDLRGANSAGEVTARFCASLGVTPLVSPAGDVAAGAAGTAIRLLVVVDNAEDALVQAEAAAALQALVAQIHVDVATARLLVTARRSVHKHASITSSSGGGGGGASSVLLPGLLEYDELESMQRGPVADRSSTSLVRVLLASLEKPQQQAAAQLSVFPSAFDEESAAAVLGLTGPGQAQALLASLYRHSVLQRADKGQHVMHMLVRQEAAKLEPEGQQLAVSRFIKLVFSRVSQWAEMYLTSAKEWRLALEAACEEAVDIAAAMELLATARDVSVATYLSYDKMEPLYRQALELRSRVLGAEHPDTIQSITHLANCIKERGQCGEAEPLYQQALELRRRVLGEGHPETIRSINNLASCLYDLGQHDRMEPLYRQALDLRRHMLGAEHPDTLTSINNLANCIKEKGQLPEAEALYREALDLRRRVRGAKHPDTIKSISNLGSCLQAAGQYTEAEPLLRQALELRRLVLGADHPDTIKSVGNLNNCIESMAVVEKLMR
ncbi:hypothetical protein HYH02_009768 [Chlamydomonas schloesseri]|uniref:Kinesin light chain n=1 Tax=Chlamydomonas schloesseri TaxID=2026947 RepID=A0A835W8V0_9CHLO|nr:hypothetical protein HYH02_009768 [Chlamydomonas schloesseri]|eukprot:KAG2441974.1 hypothetical protein HYH02_009768 [Chlamydomonas schloesseri]